METILNEATRVVGTVALYVILWAGVLLTTFLICIKKGRSDDWVSPIIISFWLATGITALLFIYNHVRL